MGILAQDTRGESPEFSPLGSGTLVGYEDTRAVLTACHVATSDQFLASEKTGLVVSESLHTFSVSREFLNPVLLGQPESAHAGPDLALLILPTHVASSVTSLSLKNFINLASVEDGGLVKGFDPRLGLWLVSGFPVEYASLSLGRSPYDLTLNSCNLIGTASLEKSWIQGDFDYVELGVVYDEESDPPTTFEGVSGGGVWRVGLSRMDGNIIIAHLPHLAGVAFYETGEENGRQQIRCHGPQSIHGIVAPALREAQTRRS